ncbi:MAG: hypothetical protein Q7S82_01155 [bacterium]|nr:hypothetical protein [bacterium]
MVQIIGMTKEDLFNLDPTSIHRLLSEEEIVYVAATLGSYWQYDYEAARKGKVGLHAELKSLRHSDGFFISRILLQCPNIRKMMAYQLVFRFNELGIPTSVWVAGIPDGATELGQDVAKIIGAKNAETQKKDGRIVLLSSIGPDETLLLVEDFCTLGTGFIEAVQEIISKQPKANILPYELVIINRGGLERIILGGAGMFRIISAANHQVSSWKPEECPLCKMGSVPIKPKATDENWRLITTSQLAKTV